MLLLATALKLHLSPLNGQGVEREYRQLHMGMEVRLHLVARDAAHADAAARRAFRRIADLEAILSDWRPASELRTLPADGAWHPVSAPLLAVLARARRVADATGGAFDPTVAPLVLLWREARRTGHLPEAAAVDAARRLVGRDRLSVDTRRGLVRLAPGTRLDLGAIAKGYILAEALGTLRADGVPAALAEAGGDLLLGDPPPGRAGWRVAVATATGDTTLMLANVAVATSGPSAQHVVIDGVRYSHVLDPRTGRPLTAARQATVVHRDGALADALSTAMTILEMSEGKRIAERLGARAVYLSDRETRDERR